LSFLLLGREPSFSPGRVADDQAILAMVADALRERNELPVVGDDDEPPDAALLDQVDVVLSMRRDLKTLRWLETIELSSARVINRPKAVRRCRRLRMLGRLQQHGLPVAPFQLIGTGGIMELAFGWPTGGVWIKRSDMHCLHQGLDVVHIGGAHALPSALEAFRSRNLDEAIIQAHSPGRTVKCYAVRSQLVGCFPQVHLLQPLITDVVAQIGTVFGLDVFGVDLVVGADTDVSIVDVNDWPSFAPCREAAAEMIAAHALRRLVAAA
jgi:glutathione synthase/RimK-type ligase-like ATP-grasp enzyme